MLTTTDRAALHARIAAEMLAAAPPAEPIDPEALLEAELTLLVQDAQWANEQAVAAEARGWASFAAMYRRQENEAIEKFMALGHAAKAS